jgi:protoporphyrinogen oxidase
MKIAVIGAGFTGLAAAHQLLKKGHAVTLYEKAERAGGLAAGFKGKDWSWPLEMHYHHLFSSDASILRYAQEIGVPVTFRRPNTSTLFSDSIERLDNPMSLLSLKTLPMVDRLRTGFVLLFLKLNPFWIVLENIPAKKFLISSMGEKAWDVLWKPLFVKKFGEDYRNVPASWFWARIKKRSAALGYPRGGFQYLANKGVKNILKKGGMVFFNAAISEIRKNKDFFTITVNGKKEIFDRVICTLPTGSFLKITKGLPNKYKNNFKRLKGIGAVNLVLELDKPFLPNRIYWLSVNDMKVPFLCVVEQTNFVSKGKYNGSTLIYIGNYLNPKHRYFSKTANELVGEYLPGLKQINKNFKRSWIKKSFLFKTPFAQPLIDLNHSRHLPDLATPFKGLYLANIEQVYPWDRGTNYAVELGFKVAELNG